MMPALLRGYCQPVKVEFGVRTKKHSTTMICDGILHGIVTSIQPVPRPIHDVKLHFALTLTTV
jgi:hypothetical protein